MASSDNTPLFLLMGVFALGALYLTKQFCPGGAIATDAFGGKLCPDYVPITSTDQEILAGGDSALGVGGVAFRSGAEVWTQAAKNIGGVKTCGTGFVLSGGRCACSRVTAKCTGTQVARLVNNGTRCACTYCASGYHNVGNQCVKNGVAGTVTGGAAPCNKVCTGGYVKNNNPCSCVCNSIVHKCGANATAKGNGKTCSCYCNSGYVVSGNKCVPRTTGGGTVGTGGGASGGSSIGPTAVQVLNAKLFIADVINRTVQACCGRAPGTTKVVQGYPSAMNSLAKMNNYSQNKILAYNNRPFAKTFRSVVMALVGSYKLNLSPTCTRQMSCLNSYSMKECGLL